MISKNRFVVSMTAIMFGLSIMIPAIVNAATFSKPSSSPSVSRPSAPVYTPPPSRPSAPVYTPPQSNNGFSRPPVVVSTPSSPVSRGPIDTSTAKPMPSPTTNSGFTKAPLSTPTNNVSSGTRSPSPPNALAAAQTRSMSATSLTAYQKERANAKQPPQPVAAADLRGNAGFGAARSRYSSVDNYMSARNNVYGNYRTSHPSTFIIVNNIHPNYGVYDSGFLTGMIMGGIGASMAQNAAWMASQQNQAWYPQYMADLNQQAVDNAELREHLAQMNAEMETQRANGGVQQAGALPPGVDPAMAIAPEAMVADPDFSQTPAQTSSHIWLWLSLLVAAGLGTLVVIRLRK